IRRQQLHGALSSRQADSARKIRSSSPPRSKTRNIPGEAKLKRQSKNPLMLVPGTTVVIFDTNCYIDYLDQIRSVVESAKWVVVVPLVVVTELDGLSTNEGKVGFFASQAVQYLQEEFGTGWASGSGGTSVSAPNKRKKWLKLQTSQGNYLPDLRVRTEDWSAFSSGSTISAAGGGSVGNASGGGLAGGVSSDVGGPNNMVLKSNDDVVLKCCFHYIRNPNPSLSRLLLPRNGPAGAVKEGVKASPVVLVTDDANLRLKARAMGIDVVEHVRDIVAATEERTRKGV
ncbi:hypothetical protein HK102_000968, partial [Quaeritorhiza haematococci]